MSGYKYHAILEDGFTHIYATEYTTTDKRVSIEDVDELCYQINSAKELKLLIKNLKHAAEAIGWEIE